VDPATGKRMKNKGVDDRSTLTANGRVSIKRRCWGVSTGGIVTSADSLLDAALATVSLGTRELCCRTNAGAKSFDKAAENLKHIGQVSLSTELLRQVVEDEGKAVQKAGETGALAPGWRAADCKVKTPEGKEVSRVYVGTDGFMGAVLTDKEKRKRRAQVVAARRRRGKDRPKLPPLPERKEGADQRYKEFKLTQFHDETMERRLVSVTRKPCDTAGRILRRDANRIGFDEADERIGNVDGGPWIVGQIVRICLVLTALCLDFYHLGEHVNAAKRNTFGEKKSKEGDVWAGELMHIVKHEGYLPFWERLLSWRGQQRSKRKKKEADGLLSYVSEREKMICYQECLRHGWRISSSTTESECGALPQRIRGAGKRWDSDNAEAVMGLEALDQSHLWDTYWSTCAWQSN
jgi:hypothetical protein